MQEEDKNLLLIDLSARPPYKPKIKIGKYYDYTLTGIDLSKEKPIIVELDGNRIEVSCESLQPILRPMSSMTEEEFNALKTETELEYEQLELTEWDGGYKTLEFYLKEAPHYCVIKVFDWLNAHHFDYRELIERGLAIEAPSDMYNIKINY